MSSKYLILMMSFTALISCDNTDFVEFSELGALRIVGVEASVNGDPSSNEIDGTSAGNIDVTLTPYISDINAGGRVFDVEVSSCLDATFAQTGQVSCDSSNEETYPNSNQFDTNNLSATSFTGAMTPITIRIANPAGLISSFSEQLRYNGITYYVLFTLTSGSETLRFVKRLRITDRGQLNQNPVIEDVLFQGSAVTAAPSESGSLSLTFTSAGSPENFSEFTSDGTLGDQTESYLISWFTSEGEVIPPRVLTNQESELRTGAAGVLIGVVRDRRGGTAVRVLTPWSS